MKKIIFEKEKVVPPVVALQDQTFLEYRGFLYAGGRYQEQDGRKIMLGQMYVEVYVPKEIRHPYPLLLLHGAAQTGCCYLYTPDGRAGWTDYFLRQGYVVYVADQPERGRSICHRKLRGERYVFSASEIEQSFTGESAVHGRIHTQWPEGEEVFDNFFSSQVDCLVGITETQELVRDASCALLDLAGPMVVLGHSQGGPCVWEIGDARPELTKAMIAIEPSGPPFVNIQTGETLVDEKGCPQNWGIAHLPLEFDPPAQKPGDLKIERRIAPGKGQRDGFLQAEPAKKLKNLKNIPAMVMTGDTSYHAPFDYLTAEFLNQAGVKTDYIYLPEKGIYGNGHMVMLEKNSSQIAGVIDDWLTEKGL